MGVAWRVEILKQIWADLDFHYATREEGEDPPSKSEGGAPDVAGSGSILRAWGAAVLRPYAFVLT
jgi:hypothetical protein